MSTLNWGDLIKEAGESGNYEYNYEVSGTDANGDAVSGNVSMNGKYGSGTITNSNGEEIEVETE